MNNGFSEGFYVVTFLKLWDGPQKNYEYGEKNENQI